MANDRYGLRVRVESTLECIQMYAAEDEAEARVEGGRAGLSPEAVTRLLRLFLQQASVADLLSKDQDFVNGLRKEYGLEDYDG